MVSIPVCSKFETEPTNLHVLPPEITRAKRVMNKYPCVQPGSRLTTCSTKAPNS